MKKEKFKIDLRNAEKEDLIMLTKVLLNLSRLFAKNGHKVQIVKNTGKNIFEKVHINSSEH